MKTRSPSALLQAHIKRHIEIVHVNFQQHQCNIFQKKGIDLKSVLKLLTETVHKNNNFLKCPLHEELKKNSECVYEDLKQRQCNICQQSFGQNT
jgi:hypothetical protein